MKQTTIGSIEQVVVHEYGQDLIPAKIDTGADSSSIWASSIVQKDGVLNYAFFGPGSTYYTGEICTADTFRVATVKNSFGHSEVRYKVQFIVQIGDRKIKSWFTLADRSRNTYPILLGKKILKNKFIVDVAKTYIHSEDKVDKKVLVISAGPSVTLPFLKKVEAKTEGSVTFTATSFGDIIFDINGSDTTVIDTGNGSTPVESYDLTYVKSHWHYPEPASALAEFLTFKGRQFLDQEIKEYTSRSKLSEMMKLAVNALPVPRAMVGYAPVLMRNSPTIIESLGFPLVLKNVQADRGADNYLVQDAESFERILSASPDTAIFAAQAYVSNEGFYRLNVFGSDVALAVYRHATSHKDPLKAHLNKPAGGANASMIELSDVPTEALELAVRGSMCMNRQIAGVDLVQDKQTGEWYILEVNNAPQIRSGSHTEEKINEFAKFIERRLER